MCPVIGGREGWGWNFYDPHQSKYLETRCPLSDLIFYIYAGLYGCNDRVLITESKFIPYSD